MKSLLFAWLSIAAIASADLVPSPESSPVDPGSLVPDYGPAPTPLVPVIPATNRSANETIGRLLEAYPLHVPIRCWVNGYVVYAAAAGQGAPSLWCNGVETFGHGLIQSSSGTATQGQIVYRIPNGFAPAVVGRSPIVVDPIMPAALELSGIVNPPNAIITIPGDSSPATANFLQNDVRIMAAANFRGVIGITIAGNKISVMIPRTGNSAPSKVCLYFHGSANDYLSHITDADSSTSTQLLMASTVQALLNNGYLIVGQNGGTLSDNWGNPESFTATKATLAWLKSIFPIEKIVCIGQSMGGFPSLRAAVELSEINRWYGIYPACNLASVYASGSFTTAMNTAFGAANSGEFATKSAGCDPLLFPLEKFAGKRFRMTASASDTVISKASNSTAFVNRIVSSAASATILNHTGNHGDSSAFNPSDIISFFESN